MKTLSTMLSKLKQTSAAMIATVFILSPLGTNAHAASLGVSQDPLDATEGVDPNIVLSIDDSGSMGWNFLPNEVEDQVIIDNGIKAATSSYFNVLYYNPDVTYTPAVDKDGVSLGASTFTAAKADGFGNSTCVLNLATNFRPNTVGDHGNTAVSGSCSNSGINLYRPGGAGTNGVAFYHVFDSTNLNCDGTALDNDCYDLRELNGTFTAFTAPTTRTDCGTAPATCDLTEERQNFANWYSYYHTRMLLTRTAASAAFVKIDRDARIAYHSFQVGMSNFRKLDGTDRTNFFTWLQNTISPSGATYLPRLFRNAGVAYDNPAAGINSPYAKDPGVTASPEYTCRQNFHIAFTDGYWNRDVNSVVNPDDATTALPAASFGVSSYNVRNPYKGGNTAAGTADGNDTLADLAFYYWIKDLKPLMTDNVPVYIPRKKDFSDEDYDKNGVYNDNDKFWDPRNDPATWQHMTTFTVGLGVNGTLTYNDATYRDIITGTQQWPVIVNNESSTVDDLWHAGINGRGAYFNAGNPVELISAFSEVISNITDRTGSSSAPAANQSRYAAGTLVFQPSYNLESGNWYGNLRAFDVTALGTVLAESSSKLDAQAWDARKIFTFDPVNKEGVPFTWTKWSGLDASVQTHIATQDILEYLRGKTVAGTRTRLHKLGDIINSEPLYVGPPTRLLPDSLEASPYSTFKTTYKDRLPLIWVGANDGMLHAFNADSTVPSDFMKESLAFIPSSVHKNLTAYSQTTYKHNYYVDGTPTERDAYFSGAWHTVLVGGLNAGGQGIYALDITNPTALAEDDAGAKSLVLWEFTDANDADLGFTYSRPTVTKMHNGKWAAIFGNGFDSTDPDSNISTTGEAVLFIVDMADGSVIKKISTGVGMAQDPKGTNTPNGLASVTPVDYDGDFVTDYIYAGDMFGNLWKFDVRSSNTTNWTVFKNKSGIAPLFIATDDVGNRQPITSAPIVGRHPKNNGYLVNFGTGKYIELSDKSDTKLQSYYGIWDRDLGDPSKDSPELATIERVHTFAQQIIFENDLQFTDYKARVTTDSDFTFYFDKSGGSQPLPKDPSKDGYMGWRMDLEEPKSPNIPYDASSNPFQRIGERVIYDSQRRGDRIIFTSIIPSSSADPCLGNGESWLMEMDAATGSRLDVTPFDYNSDSRFDQGDFVIVGWDVNGDGKIDENDRVPGTGIQHKDNPRGSRAMILVDDKGDEHKIISNENNTLTDIKESGGDQGVGRRSWQQLIPD